MRRSLAQSGLPPRRLDAVNAISIRPAGPADLAEVVRIHRAAFPDFLMTLLGPPFLRIYYRSVLRYPRGLFLVAQEPSGLVGFAAGFADPPGFYRSFRRRRASALLASIPYCLARPQTWLRLADSARQLAVRSRPSGGDGDAELSSIAVVPEAAGSGVGRRLLEAFIDASRAEKARCVRLTTDAAGNDHVNRFYEMAGFRVVARLERAEGRIMNEYALPLGEKNDE